MYDKKVVCNDEIDQNAFLMLLKGRIVRLIGSLNGMLFSLFRDFRVLLKFGSIRIKEMEIQI